MPSSTRIRPLTNDKEPKQFILLNKAMISEEELNGTGLALGRKVSKP